MKISLLTLVVTALLDPTGAFAYSEGISCVKGNKLVNVFITIYNGEASAEVYMGQIQHGDLSRDTGSHRGTTNVTLEGSAHGFGFESIDSKDKTYVSYATSSFGDDDHFDIRIDGDALKLSPTVNCVRNTTP